ncbi:MAG: tagaturonate epimerase family protein [Balneolaceae bacterium]
MNEKERQTEEIILQSINYQNSPLSGTRLYKRSIHEDGGVTFFMIRNGISKQLVLWKRDQNADIQDFSGEQVEVNSLEFLLCDLSHENAAALRRRFEFTNPVRVGKHNSYGFGDRLGNAGPAHVRSVRGTGFKPVFAQQSIRELERTRRSAEDVLDAATWSVFQEGYHDGFGADGDHLKTTGDIDRMVSSGYTMFTIDPSDYVVDEAREMSEEELKAAFEELPWKDLEDSPDLLPGRFLKNPVKLQDGFKLVPTLEEVLRGMVKYGRVITHTKKMAAYLANQYPGYPSELELSVDETDDPTTLFEHYLVASELDRLGVELVSLAPRFCGHFEKGIDFKGDLDQFRDEYIQHLAIADIFGGYKLSIHSGSDKFSVYEVIGSIHGGAVHVKTAGTSYLEALRTLAEADPELFRQILAFSKKRFNEDKKTYHISADLDRVPDPFSLKENELPALLNDNDARQVLHVAYGSVLSGDEPEAKEFKSRLMEVLENHEELHENNLVHHFEKHLNPFI